MSQTTKMTSQGPSLSKVVKTPTNGPDDQAAGIAASMAEIKSVAENPTPSIADDIAATDVHLNA